MAVRKDDKDDDLVGSLDLLVSRSPGASELYLLQYPLRSHEAVIGSDRPIVGMRVRPRQRRVQMRVSMYPIAPDNANADENGYCNSSFDERKGDKMPKDNCQTLESSKETMARANYAAARYLNPEEVGNGRGAIVLSPIHSVTQMTPTFTHIDEKNEDEMRKKKARAKDDAPDNREENDVEEPVQIGVKYRKRETEWAASKRKKSHAHLKMAEEAEPWQDVSFNSRRTKEARSSIRALFVPQTLADTKLPRISLDVDEYKEQFRIRRQELKLQVKNEDGMEGAASMAIYSALKNEPISLQEARSLPMSVAIPRMLKTARVLPFSCIKGVMTSDTEPRAVLETLKRCARLVRGCWVSQGDPTEQRRLLAVRDIVVSCFRESRIVKTAEVLSQLGNAQHTVSYDFVKSVLQEVATFKATVGWEFKYDDDTDFEIHHHNIAEWQDREWENRLKAARSQLT